LLHCLEESLSAPARPYGVDPGVPSHLEHPGRELGAKPERSQLAIYPNEGLLGDILCLSGISEQVRQEPPHVRLIRVHQFLERSRVAPGGGAYHLRIRLVHLARTSHRSQSERTRTQY
jgi:hypothetical protein